MAWGDPGISKALRLSNGVFNWGVGGQPVNMPIQQTAILRRLMLLLNATITTTVGTTLARDQLGPWNVFTNVAVTPNQQAPVVNVSGYGLYLINVAKSREKMGNTPDTNIIAETSAEATTDTYAGWNFTTAQGPSAARLFEEVPIAQRIASLGGDVGLWPLQNPAMQLGLSVTPNSPTGATPYSIFSLTAGAEPYTGTGASTAVLNSPTLEAIREMWSVPQSEANLPPFQLVSTWVEEQPQGANVASATTWQWIATPLSGILARIISFTFDSALGTGVAASNLTAANAIALTYDADTAKYQESSYSAQARQADYYGFELPQGVYIHDLLGGDLTLQDALNTNTLGNIKLKYTFNAAIGAASFAKVIRQIVSPLEVK